MYMMWFDDSKQPFATKVTQGIEAYTNHFRTAPNVCLVPTDEAMQLHPSIRIEPRTFIQKNNFWFGYEHNLLEPAE